MNKRFTLKPYDGIYCDVFDKDVEIAEVHRDDARGLCNLLNKLHEEKVEANKNLSALIVGHEATVLNNNAVIKQLREENAQFKENNALMRDILDYIVSHTDVTIGKNNATYRVCMVMDAKHYKMVQEAIK